MKTNTLRLMLDVLLLGTFLLLMDPRSFFGLAFHEWAGLLIGAFFIVHILLNWAFVCTVTLGFFGRACGRPRMLYLLDVLLLVAMGAAIWSGLPIARTIDFSWMGFERDSAMYWRTLHASSSTVALLVLGVHLGLHWSWIVARCRLAPERAS